MAQPALTVGLDVGGTKCLGVAVDEKGDVLAEHRIETPAGTDPLLAGLAGLVASLAGRAGPVGAVGVGAAGLVDRGGRLCVAPNLAGVIGVPLATVLSERLGLPVVVENDATCAAWAERLWGVARHVDDVVLVTLGTGIGGGLITGGRLHRGANGFAGEVGHMIVDADGPECPCGQRGCWERFASGSGLARLGREAVAAGKAPRVLAMAGGGPGSVRGEHVAAAAAEGDTDSLAILADFAGWVALGLVNLANVLDPGALVLGGGLVELGDLLLVPVRARYESMLFAWEHRRPAPILMAALGERAGALGAASLARRPPTGTG